MNTPIVPAVLGFVIILIGLSNIKGNLASIHWYHRQRVAEEDQPVFGKLIGSGTLLIGAAMAFFSLFSLAAERMHHDCLIVMGAAILIAAVIAGLAISFYAMIKYNKGIF